MRDSYLSSVDSARTLLDHPDLGGTWNQPSALERMTIGALTAHLSRAVTLPVQYLDRAGQLPFQDAAGYFMALAERRDTDLDSEVAEAVRNRAAETAEPGLEAVVLAWDHARETLDLGLTPEVMSRGIAVLGSSLPVADYLITRMVELVIHADDLAVSLGTDTPEFGTEVTVAVISCLVEISTRRSSPLSIVRALARVERADPDVLPAF